MKELCNPQIISKLVVTKLLRTIALLMRNFIANSLESSGYARISLGIG